MISEILFNLFWRKKLGYGDRVIKVTSWRSAKIDQWYQMYPEHPYMKDYGFHRRNVHVAFCPKILGYQFK